MSYASLLHHVARSIPSKIGANRKQATYLSAAKHKSMQMNSSYGHHPQKSDYIANRQAAAMRNLKYLQQLPALTQRAFTLTYWSDRVRHSFIAYYPYAAAAKTGFIAGSLSSNASRGESVDALYSKNTYIGSADSEKTDEPVEMMMTPLLDICKIIVKQTKYSGYNLDRISIKTKSGNGISGKWEYEVAGKKFTFTEPSDEMNINFSSITLSDTDIEAFMLAYNSAALSEEAEFEVSLANEKAISPSTGWYSHRFHRTRFRQIPPDHSR